MSHPGVKLRYPALVPTEPPGADNSERTMRNVEDSYATLILVPSSAWGSPGTELTVRVAQEEGKPLLV